MRAPAAFAFPRCTVASYFACTGQSGMHDALAQHAGRPSKTREFRACGETRTLKPNAPATRSISRSPRVAGNPGIG
jgi:hypothetical protein